MITGRTPFTGSSNPLLADSQPDIDNDTLPDGGENFYLRDLLSGPAGDNDGDTFTNDAEFVAGSDPLEPLSTPSDPDADGLPDSWEQDNFGGKTNQTGSGDADVAHVRCACRYDARQAVRVEDGGALRVI